MAQRPLKLLKDERFERFGKHRSIVDLQQTSKKLKYARFTKVQQTFERLTLYEDRNADWLSKRLKNECRGHTRSHEPPCELVRQVRQNVSKRLKARQMCAQDIQ